jgi:hypothetical protein
MISSRSGCLQKNPYPKLKAYLHCSGELTRQSAMLVSPVDLARQISRSGNATGSEGFGVGAVKSGRAAPGR